MHKAKGIGSVVLALALCACAGYQARPLPVGPDVLAAVSALKTDPARLRLSPLRPITIDPRDGLDPLEVAVLAVLNNPDLRAKRAAGGVDAAQIFAAGLLPDPQISLGLDFPTAGPDHQIAYSVGAALDLAHLLARSATLRSARFTARRADLDVLWAEWGVAQQARQLAETAMANEARARHLRDLFRAAAERYTVSSAALENRDVTLQTNAADLAVKADTQAQLATAEHDAQKARRDLNALLNLDVSVVLPLVEGPDPGAYVPAALGAALANLPGRRPDLLALEAGYAAQDANVRKAVLAQFPLSQLGLVSAKDPAGTVTQGLSAALALPIFNGGRGDVRVQTATRAQLRAEYQARLDQAAAEVANAEAELAGARARAAALRIDVPRLESLAGPATAAYRRGDLDSQAYLTLAQNVLAKRADLDDRELAARLWEIALETALFLPPANAGALR